MIKASACLSGTQHVSAHRDLPSDVPFILQSGWAASYSDTYDGRRQLLGIMLPGDRIDSGSVHPIVALSDCNFEPTGPNSDCIDANALVPGWATHADFARWVLMLGQGNVIARLTYLLRDVFRRCGSLGVADGSVSYVQMTQEGLAGFCCATPVHINRALTCLRRQNIITIEAKYFTLLDTKRFNSLADLRERITIKPCHRC